MTVLADGTALYRIRGEGSLLLYVGVSDNFGRRWKEHAKQQPWWAEMRSLSVDRWYESRDAAEMAERAAIKVERPKYNQQHAVRLPLRGRLEPIPAAVLDLLPGGNHGWVPCEDGSGMERPWVPGWSHFPEAHQMVADGVLHPCGRGTMLVPEPCGECPQRSRCSIP
jgi:predicted GIY-YIG superfamily endonuclease